MTDYNPKEYSVFELQCLKKYSTKLRDEDKFYEEGEPQ